MNDIAGTARSGTADVAGARLYYELSGPAAPKQAAQATTVVLIHGMGVDHRMWAPQVAAFGRHHQVLRYDMRGFGRSSLPDGDYTPQDDLAALLDHLGIERAHVLGLSRGGAVAIAFAIAYPARTRSLIAVDAVLRGFDGAADFVDSLKVIWRTARESGVAAAKALWREHPLFDVARRQPDTWAAFDQMFGDYHGWHWANPDPEMAPDPPPAQRLGEIAAPALVVVGEHDIPAMQRTARALADGIDGAELALIPGAGHLPSMEAPQPFNTRVLEFLRRLDTATA